MSLYIGLLSGTSADAIDAALVSFQGDQPQILATQACKYPENIRREIIELYEPGDNEIDRLGVLDNALADLFARSALSLLEKANIQAQDIQAIGCHGQTIRHRPHLAAHRFTLQIGNPSLIAERTGIPTIADFRRRDIACGGQGAPLAPALHQDLFHSNTHNRVVINIGGIANISYLPSQGDVLGFDCGPGNGLMDSWIKSQKGLDYDANGAWAKTGVVNPALLKDLLDTPYFALSPPKSTGREDFCLSWLETKLEKFETLKPEDVQATLLAFTTNSICNAITRYCPATSEVYVCGGGSHNQLLMSKLEELLNPIQLSTTEALGLDPDWVEAVLFAWLAKRTIEGLPGNLPAVTGASHPCVLGAIYPA